MPHPFTFTLKPINNPNESITTSNCKTMKATNYKSLAFLVFIFAGCSSPLIETVPAIISDTGSVTITCNANKGNKGLLDINEPVYVHLGLITDSSVNSNQWRYVKFKWGSTDSAALATPMGDNSWSYTIPHIRRFFGVKGNEKLLSIAVLFRQGNCIDTFCRVLRNEDRSDIFIPINDTK